MKAGSALLALAFLAGACFGDDRPRDSLSTIVDPLGDVARGPAADGPQPPGIDLGSVELARAGGTLSFTATMADPGGEASRLWVVRFRTTRGVLLWMLYAGDQGVMLCDHAEFCSERVEGATVERSPYTVHVRLPLPKLPDRFEWEASVSSSTTANIDDTWNDYASKASLRG